MITVAKNAGFCFGVKRATDTIEELIRKKGKGDVICTLGKLIHNAQYNKFLEDNGVTVIEPDDIDRLCQMAIEGTRVFVVVRAHGIEYDIQEKLENCTAKSENFRYIDCTCPYVKKIHKIADENSKEGEIFFLIGQKEHPEVKSIMSYVHNKGETFDTASELEEYIKCHDLSNFAVNMAAQTTQKLTEWEKSEKIKRFF